MISQECTIRFGICLSANLILLTTGLDYFDQKNERSFTRIAYFDINDRVEPWGFTDLVDLKMESACQWGQQLRAALDEEGVVRLFQPRSSIDAKVVLPEAGVFRKGAQGYGYVNRIRAVGDGLYVCGAHRQVYRYIPGERNPLSGRFIDFAGPMRQPPLPKPPAREGAAFEAWADQDIIQFNDIAGPSESDIYASGDETWHFDGQAWRQLQLKAINETMHVILVVDAQRILIGGSNGYLFLGDATQGFANISHEDDNHTITGLAYVNNTLFVATDHGLFTLDKPGEKLKPYRTGLNPELQDTHLLEAKDGVLWSFGYKDLAYLDSTQPNPQWVRVHHPDNPRIGEVPLAQAPSTVALRRQAAQAQQTPQPALPTWLPAPPHQAGTPDIGGLIARVGHKGVGGFALAQLVAQGLTAQQVLQVQDSTRYTVAVPKHGLQLTLQYRGPTRAAAQPEAQPEHWALAEVLLQTQNADPYDHWQGPWPGGIDPYAPDLRKRARALWGEPDVDGQQQMSFFVDGSQGAAWVVNLEWTNVANRLRHLRVLHLGGYLPWKG